MFFSHSRYSELELVSFNSIPPSYPYVNFHVLSMQAFKRRSMRKPTFFRYRKTRWSIDFESDTSKKCQKLAYYSLWIFSIRFIHYSNRFIYQSIELGLLYKTVYMTFLFNLNIEWKRFKYSNFFAYTIVYIF